MFPLICDPTIDMAAHRCGHKEQIDVPWKEQMEMADILETTPQCPYPRALTRRGLLKATAAAGLTAAVRTWTAPAAVRAQGLTGKITVGYEDPNNILTPVVEQAIEAVRSAHPDAQIEARKAPAGNFATQLFLAINTGRAPDVFLLTGLGIGELGAAGFLEPLDPYLEEWDGWAEYPDEIKAALKFQNHFFAVPYVIDTHFLYYRKDLFERAGLPREWQPATPDDILAAARQLKASLPDVIPYAIYAGANGGNGTAVRGFLPLLYAYGGSMQDEAGKWIIDSCAIRSTLRYYETAYQIDQTVPQQVMTATNPARTMRQAFGNGELGIIFEGSWAYADWEAIDPEAAGEQIGFILHPTADGRPPFTIGGLGNTWYINAASEHKDLAWEFIKAMNTREAQVALNLADPHIPARADAAADPAFEASPFLQAMIASIPAIQISPPDPAYRKLVGIVQNATGIVATGDATPEEAVTRYASELTRVLGAENVVALPCE